MSLLLAALVALAALLVARTVLGFTIDPVAVFQQRRRRTAAQLTEDQLLKFKVFLSVRNAEGSEARVAVLEGTKEAGFSGAMAAASTGRTAKQLDAADAAAAQQSGLTVEQGREVLEVVGQYYLGVFSGTESRNAEHVRMLREQFARDFGADKLALVQKYEADFMPVISAWVSDTKRQMRGVGF